MALIVETGACISGANSYVSLAEAQQYLTDRGITLTPGLEEGHVLRGADYVNTFGERFKGTRLIKPPSTMQWPRFGVLLDDIWLDTDVIPDQIKDAQIETAIEIANNRNPHATISARDVKKQKIADLEIEYESTPGASLERFDYPRVMALLRPLLTDDLFRVTR